MPSDRILRMLKESEGFGGEKDCYIHLEMKDGRCERIMGGGTLPIFHALSGVIVEIAKATNKTPGEVIIALSEYQQTLEMILENEEEGADD